MTILHLFFSSPYIYLYVHFLLEVYALVFSTIYPSISDWILQSEILKVCSEARMPFFTRTFPQGDLDMWFPDQTVRHTAFSIIPDSSP